MVLEVISPSSEKKDEDLQAMYYVAGIVEYWVVDARTEHVRFDILRRGPSGFVAMEPENGRIKSEVFGRSFQLLKGADPLGNPTFELDVAE